MSPSMTNDNEGPRAVDSTCLACGGMGGDSRGTGFDACDVCRGEGRITRLVCTAPGLVGECGLRSIRVATFHDQQQTQLFRCLNGHRWRAQLSEGGWQWTRLEDVAAAESAVA